MQKRSGITEEGDTVAIPTLVPSSGISFSEEQREENTGVRNEHRGLDCLRHKSSTGVLYRERQ